MYIDLESSVQLFWLQFDQFPIGKVVWKYCKQKMI